MDLQLAATLALAVFQFTGGIMLFDRPPAPVRAVRVIAILLMVNGVVSGIEGFVILDGPGGLAWRAIQAVDALTSPLLLLLLIESFGVKRMKQELTLGIVSFGGIHALLLLFVPGFHEATDVFVRHIPLFVTMSVLIISFAGKADWRGWVALAFLPRVIYFAVHGLSSLQSFSATPAAISYVAIVPVAILATILALRGGPVGISVTLPLLMIGPFVAVLEIVSPDSGWALPNYVTLSLVRPLILYVAFLPGRLMSLGRATGAAAATGIITLAIFSDVIPVGSHVSLLAALGSACIVAAALDAYQHLTSPGPKLSESSRSGRAPQWQALLLALQGSSQATLPIEPKWTHEELHRATGIPRQRVSEFGDLMNGTAERKLREFHPDGLHRTEKGEPIIVISARGRVRDGRGLRSYYRLTVLGETLAGAIAARNDGTQQAPATATTGTDRADENATKPPS